MNSRLSVAVAITALLSSCENSGPANPALVASCEQQGNNTSVCECAANWLEKNAEKGQFQAYTKIVAFMQRKTVEADGAFEEISNPLEQMRIMNELMAEAEAELDLQPGEVRAIAERLGPMFNQDAVKACQSD